MKKWLIVLVIFIAGCSSQTQQGSLFLLPTKVAPLTASQDAPTLILTSNLAEYLDQAGLVYRTSETEVVLAKHNRWAHKISAQITHHMMMNLRAKQTAYWPEKPNSALKSKEQVQLQLNFTKFNGSFTGEAELSGEWRLINPQGILIKSEYFELKTPLKKEGYEELVLSLSDGLDQLATLIAKQISQGQP
jgi:uncharacterized lipoprotein YmbA